MAAYNIALVSEDKTHRAATYINSVLENQGHTVTLFNASEVSSSNLSSFDIIVCPRFSGTTTICGYLRDYIDSGIPVLLGGPNSGSYLTATPLVWMGMAGAVYFDDGRQGTYLLDVEHPITAPESPPVQINVYSTPTWMAMTWDGSAYSGTRLGQYSIAMSSTTLLAIEAGTNDLFGNPFGCRCGFIGWMYSLDTYTLTTDAQEILGRFVDWCCDSGETTELEDAALTLTAAAYQLDDTGLWLSATDGTVLEDLPARLEAAGYSLEDLSAPLSAYLQDLEDVPAYLTTVARVLLDAPLSLQAHALAREDLPAALRACAQRLEDLGLYLTATDAQVLHDLGVYLTATDAQVTDDVSLRLAAVARAPRYAAAISQRVSSVVREVP